MRGFTLVELMIALVLGLLIVLAIGTVFNQSSDNYRQDERLSSLQDNLRFAMAQLTSDLEMTGFWSELHDPAAVDVSDPSLGISTDCGPAVGWAWDLLTALEAADNGDADVINSKFPCIDKTEIVPGQDAFSIKRVVGTDTDAASLEEGTTYLQTNGTEGQLFRELAASATPQTPLVGTVTHWRYHPVIYFLRDYHVVAGDGVPTLCRKYLLGGATPAFSTECIAPGIEQMQLEFGVDRDGNGRPERYLDANAVASLVDVVTVRVTLLGRSEQAHVSYANDKTYRLGNAPDFTPSDNFYRRSATTVVQLRNTARLRLVN
jgi:type IV pilus assembly protein PilW